ATFSRDRAGVTPPGSSPARPGAASSAFFPVQPYASTPGSFRDQPGTASSGLSVARPGAVSPGLSLAQPGTASSEASAAQPGGGSPGPSPVQAGAPSSARSPRQPSLPPFQPAPAATASSRAQSLAGTDPSAHPASSAVSWPPHSRSAMRRSWKATLNPPPSGAAQTIPASISRPGGMNTSAASSATPSPAA